tara:strand:+ start:380 stop:880 length:501 start_codon:yes stop_codon:yes gene_type:complete
MTYTLIDSVTLGSSAASVTFSAIDQSFGDLVLVTSALGVGDVYPGIRFNSDSSSTYSYVVMRGNGSTSSSSSSSTTNAGIITAFTWASGTNANLSSVSIMDYAATDKHKSWLSRAGQANGGSGYGTEAIAGRWPQTSAITSIEVVGGGGTYAAGSTFHLYGIAKAL